MNHLIIYAHPNPKSFNHAVLKKAIEASEGHHVVVRDLYALNINPKLDWDEFQETLMFQYPADIKIEHLHWQRADLITLIYPLWWMGFPAILKGYLDRVLSYGFAYSDGEYESVGLLGGKKMQQFVTIGNPLEKYERQGFLQAFEHTLGDGLFNFCGIKKTEMHYFGDVGLSDTDYAAMLREVEESCKTQLNA